MSAFVGIYYLDGRSVATVDLERMMDSLAHRGPDGAAVWSDGSIGFGHRLLWTTPESLYEKVPLANQRGDVVITADARIDNRQDLAAALDLNTSLGPDIPDSQLILAAYEKWGVHCPSHLLGDFAFAIWDKRAQRVYCARDPMGIKSLYYYHNERVFVCASEIKALLCLADVPRQVNEVRVGEHLAQLFEDNTGTFYRSIFRLPAATGITVDPADMHLQRYWSLDPAREIRLRSDEEYAEAFREIFGAAVRCRLRSAFPVGSLLSGGLDSSSIVCMARQMLIDAGNQPLHTFSAIFPSLPEADLRKLDERRYIAAILEMGEIEPHYIQADRLSPLADVERVLWHTDEPFLAPNLYLHWALYHAAHEQGIRTLLDGLDGDTTVSHGLEYLTQLTCRGRWRTLIREASALAEKSSVFFTPRRIIWEFGIVPLIPQSLTRISQVLRGQTTACWLASMVINPDFAKRIEFSKHTRTLIRRRPAFASAARGQHWSGLTSGLIPYTLELADKATGAFALEARYPFFDRRLVEFCLALPPEQKLQQGWTRAVMRRAMANVLPPTVQWRISKANLSPNFTRQLLHHEHAMLDEIIVNTPALIAPYVDLPTLRAAYSRYAAQPMLQEKDGLTVYGATMLALWLLRVGCRGRLNDLEGGKNATGGSIRLSIENYRNTA